MLGEKIRELRKSKGMTLNELATKIDFTASYLSQIERELIEPSLSALRKIADGLDVTMYYFLADETSDTILIKKEERKRLDLPASSIIYEFITPIADAKLKTKMDIIYFELEPKSWSSEEPLIHTSDECILILNGKVEILVGDKKYILNTGDSIYVKENNYHRLYNLSDEKSIGISTICPALY